MNKMEMAEALGKTIGATVRDIHTGEVLYEPESGECGTCRRTLPWHAPSCPWAEVSAVEDALEGAE